MINYDSFSRCHLADIFFRYSRGSKRVNGMLSSSCGRQVAGPSSLPVVVVQTDERHTNRPWVRTHKLKR